MPPTTPEIAPIEPQAPSLAQRFAWSLRFQTVVLSMLLGISAVVFTLEVARFGPESDRTRESLREVRRVHMAMLDQETGIRGYLLAHDRRFLEPHTAGTQQMTSSNTRLSALLAGDRVFGQALLEFRLAQEMWRTHWAAPAVGDPMAEVNLADGKAMFDLYRGAEATLEAALDQELAAIVRQRRLILLGAATLQLLMFGLALIGGRRRLAALHQAMLPAVNTVLAAMRRGRDGHLEPVVRQPSTAEFDDIQAGLDEMIRARALERGRVLEQMHKTEALTGDLRQMLATAREFSGTLNLRYVVRALARSACAIARQPRAVVWLVDETARRLDPIHDTEGLQGAPTGLEPLEIGAGLVGRAARYGRTMAPGGSPLLADADAPPELPGEVAVPLIVGARVVGVVQLSGGTGARTPDTLEMLEILASHAASAIESARLHQSTEEHSQRDALTRLYNRRRLNHDLDEEVRRCRRYHRPLSFIMLDVDHFKRLNDTHGHAKGDDILQELGRVLEEAVRDTDTPYRYGGEEFCVLVRETGLEGARELAERLRARIADHFAHANGEPPVTASLGVATLSDRMASAAEMVQAADRSLYEAKRAGRNRVVVTSTARPEAVS